MAGVEHIPAALFVTAEGLSLDAINRKLQQLSRDGVWDVWLATGNYNDAPKVRTDNRLNDGTTAPVQSFTSQFAGKTIEEVAEWLKNAPEHVDLDRRFFGVLDEHSEPNDTITFCRIGDGVTEGKKGELQHYPEDANEFSFSYIPPGKFDDNLISYKRLRQSRGGPDLSKGEPDEPPFKPRRPRNTS